MKSQINAPSVRSQSACGRCFLLALALAVGMLAATLSSRAATYSWTNASPASYTTAANWSPNTVPGAADTAYIGNTGWLTPGECDYNTATASGVAQLNLGNVANSSGTLVLSAGTLGVTNSAANSFILGGGNPSMGTFTVNGGAFTVVRNNANNFYQDSALFGNALNASGTFTLNSGTATFLCGVELGNYGGATGTVNVYGGNFIDSGWFGLARGATSSGSGVLNVSGGDFYVLRNPGTDTQTGNGICYCQGGTNGALNVSGSGSVYCEIIRFSNGPGSGKTSTETFNVSGGTLYIGGGGIYNNNGAGTHNRTLTVSGGTFRTLDLAPNTGGTLGLSTVLSDGTNWNWDATLPVTLNTSPGVGYINFAPEATRTITLSNAFSGSGGLTMSGPGTLVMNAANTYNGATTLSGGTLAGFGSISSSAVTINSGATLAPGDNVTPATFNVGNLTMNGGTALLKLSASTSSGNDMIMANGSLTLQGVSTIKVVPTGSLSATAPYTAIQYTGSLLGSGSLNVISDSQVYSFRADTTSVPGSVLIYVSGNAANLTWKGNDATHPTYWDHTTVNWYNSASNSSSVFYNGDKATFDDSASTGNVVLVADEQPTVMTMLNNTTAYTFSGSSTLTCPLDLEGTGVTTLAMPTLPTMTGITNNSGTLIFNLANGGVNTINAPISDNGGYHGTIVQAGTNTLLLSGNNQTMTASLLVTNGVLRYTNANNLGVPAAPLYATNNGTLDMNAVYPGIKNIIIAGAGFNGQGALISATGNSPANGPVNVALAGDATIGAPGTVRWDFCNAAASSPQIQGNDYKLTKVGTGTTIIYDQYDGDTHLGDIDITAGRLGFQIVNGGTVLLGDSSKTLTVESNATLTFYDITNGVMNKNLVMNGGNGTIGGTYNGTLTNGACFDSAGVATTTNSFAGPITLVGSNNLFGMRRPLSLTGNISGSGGFVVGVSPVGAGTLPLYLSGINSYTGPTIISNSCQIVVGAGSSLGNSSLIQVNTGANLDVSALASLALGAGQTIIGAGTNIGNLVVGSGAILAPSFPGVAGTLTVKGNLTLQSGSTNVFKLNPGTGASDAVAGISSVTYGGTLILSNLTASAYKAGTNFHLFSASIYNSSSFTALIPATPGTGLLWDTSRLTVDGTIGVAAETPPQFTSVTLLADHNFEFTFSANNNDHYTLWASTNLTLPFAQWTDLGSGTMGASPLSFKDLGATNYPQRFYRITVP